MDDIVEFLRSPRTGRRDGPLPKASSLRRCFRNSHAPARDLTLLALPLDAAVAWPSSAREPVRPPPLARAERDHEERGESAVQRADVLVFHADESSEDGES